MDGAELRRRRREIGLTQDELGRLLGVPQNTVSRWEKTSRIGHPKMLSWALEGIEARARWIDLREAMAQRVRRDDDDG